MSAKPSNSHALCSLAQIAAHEQRFADAAALLRKALRVDATNAAAHFNLSVVLSKLGELEAALTGYDQAIALSPRFAQAHFMRADLLATLNRLEASLDGFDRAIELEPAYAEAYLRRGKVLYDLKRLEASLASYELAISHRPTMASAHCNRGIVLAALGQYASAVESYDRAIAINPRDPGSFYNRGVAFKELRRLDEALSSYTQAVAINPEFAEAYCNRGTVLKDLGEWAAALTDYDRAIALKETLAEAYHNKANALAALGRVDAALLNCDKAIALKSDLSGAHFSRATFLLLAGDFERGWPAYEWRWQKHSGLGVINRSQFQTAPWLGETSIEGRTILLYAEQGFGDTLQFCRYATLVAALGARVILQVPQPLMTLLTSLEGVSEVVASGEVPAAFDHHCALMSLPLAFKTTLVNVPASPRYLHGPADRTEFWREKLGASKAKLKVGLVWSGGFRPHQPDVWPVNARRNIPLEQLAPLRHPDVEFFSLQVGQPAAGDLSRVCAENWGGPAIIDYTSLLTDFSDTAGFIENLDLVIAVDTSTAHLAGALGKPVWILNRFDTCWRWHLHREDSPWYPTARLYRQRSPGDWSDVVRRVHSNLLALVT